MRCPICRGETPDGRRFCADCGSPLGTPRCGSCGAELLAGKAYCADCGSPVTSGAGDGAGTAPAAGTVLASQAPGAGLISGPTPGPVASPLGALPEQAPVAERRICSVLFVDLVGFTPLSEKRDPEAVRELLSAYFERAQTIVGRYGGTIEKFIGDAVMAVWGAPVANEDDAERAVRSGLELVEAVAHLGEESATGDLRARGGVVTGEVAVTIGRVSEGMVLGDTVNSASRLQSVAEPGTVLVDESTFHATSGAIAFEEVGALSLKGKEEPVAAWRALRVVAQRKGVGRSQGLEPPFVGRDGELRLVKDLLRATIDEGRARLVSVTGVPGIGKSRLVWELLKYVDGLAETVSWHQGRSPAYGEGVTFWALGEMVRMRARISESEDAQSSRAKIDACLSEYLGDAEERRWVEPRLLHLLGLAEAPPGDREELFSAWRAFFEAVADSGPSVMVFEDLHRADPGLIDFVESILEWSRNHPILVVTLARPELVDRRPTWGAGQRSFSALHLERLSEEAMRALVDGFVRGLPDSLAGEILERSEGVPLYAVEMVRSLVDGGSLVERGGAYVVSGDLTSLRVPETLHALIGSRLDALPPEQKALLKDAAVLGSTFSADALAMLQGVEAPKLDQDLRDLVRKEFLSVDTNPLSPERGQYGFVQSLIHEVARSRLARRDRSAKHLAVAAYYESLDDPELTAAVAAHYVEAFHAVPESDAGPLAAIAREWLSRAGERALSLGSPEQAEAFFRRALELAPEGGDRIGYLEKAAEAAAAARHHEEAVSLLEEAISAHEACGDANRAAGDVVNLADALCYMRRFVQAREVCERALGDGKVLDDVVRAKLAESVARCLVHSGKAGDALSWTEIALEAAERSGEPAVVAACLGGRSGALFHLGRRQESVVLARGVAKLAEELGDLVELSVALLSLSVYLLGDDPVSSASIALRAAEVARRVGRRDTEMMNLFNAAETSVYLGRWGEARTAIVELEERVQTDFDRMWLDTIDGLLSALTGEGDRGQEMMTRYAGEAERTEFFSQRTTFHTACAMARLSGGDLAGALTDALKSVELDPNGINAPSALAVCARAQLWQGDVEGVTACLEKMAHTRGR
ncbi:MAG: adenylate/guanylate cyclase domain-containing protein, partial [Acidimicrobiales bacterium]